MHFASDNSGAVPTQVMDALVNANSGYTMAYGNDELTAKVQSEIRRIFDAPDASVFLVATGSAANSLALASLCHPWQTVFCSPLAHIHEDECNAPEFFTGGAKLTLVPGDDRMTPQALRATILGEETRGVHGPGRGPVSITQVTERGNVYDLQTLQNLCSVAKEFGLPVHLDGARFANAMVALGCSAADMTWKAGVDVVSFGGTKNGLLGVEAVVYFDPAKAQHFEYLRKRGGHLFSKHRYLAAQMAAYLQNDLWIDLAQQANAACARLTQGLRKHNQVEIVNDPRANMLFARMPRGWHQAAYSAGASYHLFEGSMDAPDDQPLMARFVCDWAQTSDGIDQFLNLLPAR